MVGNDLVQSSPILNLEQFLKMAPLGGDDLALALGVAFLAGGWSVVVRIFAKRPSLPSVT